MLLSRRLGRLVSDPAWSYTNVPIAPDTMPVTNLVGWEGDDRMTQDLGTIHEAYKALDDLLKAVSNLPMKFIVDHPPLHKAFDQGTLVIDQAVKEGRYVSE